MLEPVQEQAAVGQLRQRVVRRLHHEGALHVLELRHVAHDRRVALDSRRPPMGDENQRRRCSRPGPAEGRLAAPRALVLEGRDRLETDPIGARAVEQLEDGPPARAGARSTVVSEVEVSEIVVDVERVAAGSNPSVPGREHG